MSLSDKIKERDGYQCRLCGSPKKLEAHHLYGQKRFPELAYVPQNLITLCRKCHRRFHHFCPNGINTGHNFLKFLQDMYDKGHTRARYLEKQVQPLIVELDELVTKSKSSLSDQEKVLTDIQALGNRMMRLDWGRIEPKYEIQFMIRNTDRKIVHQHVEMVNIETLKDIMRRVYQSFGIFESTFEGRGAEK